MEDSVCFSSCKRMKVILKNIPVRIQYLTSKKAWIIFKNISIFAPIIFTIFCIETMKATLINILVANRFLIDTLSDLNMQVNVFLIKFVKFSG